MIETTLFNLLNTLHNHHRTRDEILAEAIQTRLDKSLNSYNEDILSSYLYLTRRKNPDKIMRKLNK